MKDLHNWFETVNQLAISITIVLELLRFVLKELKNSIGGLAVPEFFDKWILGQIYPGMLAIFSQGCTENGLKIGRGYQRRGHVAERSISCVGRWKERPKDRDPRAYWRLLRWGGGGGVDGS
jgi:hypothetical protein